MMFKIFLLLCISVVHASFEEENYEESNLPNHVEPLSYDLKITPDLSKFIFYGKVNVDLRLKLSTDVVKLHCKNLKINEFKLYEKDRLSQISIRFNQTKNFCTFTAFQQLSPDSTYVLSIEFKGDLKENKKGLYRTSYEINGRKKWLVATNFYDNYAREVFPCFDEPRFKATFTISVAIKPDQRILSSTACNVIHSHRDKNLVWNSCQKTPSLPTYKLAFVVLTEYSFTPEISNMTKIWTRPNLIKHVQSALNQSDKILKQLENFISIPHKIHTLNIGIIPGDEFRASTENWELFLFPEMDLISDEKSTSQLQNQIITTSLCHQFARHWFGGQVTPLSWNYAWLTEALAGYLTFIETASLEPTWRTDDIFNVDVLQPTLWEELTNSQALTSIKKTKFQIDDEHQLTYQNKGTSIIRMLEHIISKSSLRSVINKYLSKSISSNNGLVTPDNLFDALNHQNDIDSFPLPPHLSIVDVMKTWTENQGYPVIKVTRNYQSGAIDIEQRACASSQATTTPAHQEWIIPINYATKSHASFSRTAPQEWIFSKQTNSLINVDHNDWIIFNLQQTSYYRVNYDQHNWNLLITQLKENMTEIHYLNRAQLIDDAFTFAFENELPYAVPLKLAAYLQNETEIVPILSAVFHLNKLYTKYEDTSSHKLFHMYIQKILVNQTRILRSDDNSIKMKKSSILSLACKVGLSSCVQSALQEYHANEKDLSKVQPDLKEVVFCTALREIQDSDVVYEKLMSTYRSCDIAYEKISILKTLGCTRNENLLQNILSNVFHKSEEYIAMSHADYVYDSILSTSIGITTTLKFIQYQILQIREMKNEKVQTLKKILHKIIPKVQSTEHTKILKLLHADFNKLGQNYSVFTELVQRARSLAVERVKESNKNSVVLKDIFYDVLDIPSIVRAPTTNSPSNAAIVSVPMSLLGLLTVTSVLSLI